jgi:hypothetical protein
LQLLHPVFTFGLLLRLDLSPPVGVVDADLMGKSSSSGGLVSGNWLEAAMVLSGKAEVEFWFRY